MDLRVEVKQLIDAVTNRSISYLKEEMHIAVESMQYNLQDAKKLTLRDLTSLVTVGGNLGMYIAFSFDTQVIRTIFEVYTQDIEVSEDETDMYIEETAGDVINTVVGNALQEVSGDGPLISLTPPVILTQARSITRTKQVYFYTANLNTDLGTLSVMAIGPENLFDDMLNYKESE